MAGPGCSDDRVPCCDIDCDDLQLSTQNLIDLDQVQTAEIVADGEANSAGWRQAQLIRFKEVDPMESAAAEVVLSGTARNV